MEPSEAGRALLPGLIDGFECLHLTDEAYQRRTPERPFTVSIAPAFGGKWRLRRLDCWRPPMTSPREDLYGAPGLRIRVMLPFVADRRSGVRGSNTT